jgi:hypothetical protein
VRASFSKHGEAVEAIFELIRKDQNLRFLDEQIYPEWCYLRDDHPPGWQPGTPTMLPDKPEEIRAGFYVCNSLIQLMEDLYHDLDLEEEHDHPDNRGWMNLFRHWSWAGMFRVTWVFSASTYGARFRCGGAGRGHLGPHRQRNTRGRLSRTTTNVAIGRHGGGFQSRQGWSTIGSSLRAPRECEPIGRVHLIFLVDHRGGEWKTASAASW